MLNNILVKSGRYAFFLILILPALSPANNKKTLARVCYQKGLQFSEEGKLDSAIFYFKRAIKYNRKFAAAHNQLALVYMKQGTIHSRFLADIEFHKAILFDRRNPEYHFNRAQLYLKRDMRGAAIREFKKVIKYDPQNFRAYYHIGLIMEKDVLRYRDMIDPEGSGVIVFRKFAEKDKQKTIYYFNKAIALNPRFTTAYYRLGLLYYEFGDLEEMISLLEKATKINPRDKNCHLFLGFAYHQTEKYELAAEEYEKAKALMLPFEREVFESVESIMSNEEKEVYEKATDYKKKELAHAFWKSKDPFLLTPVNERKLEHYSRVAYANLRYSDPEKNIEGWKTDPGKVYIRFGKPDQLYRTRPEIGGITNASQFNPLSCSKEVWLYDDFQFVFEDRFLTRRYEFAWGDRPENDYRIVFDQMIKTKPEQYRFIPEDKSLPIIADITNFKGYDHKTKLNINYAIPADSIYFVLHRDKWRAHLKQGIFIFDNKWNEISRVISEHKLFEEQVEHINDSNYFINQDSIEIKPGSYILALEAYDVESQKLASLRNKIEAVSFNTNKLQLSDIILASNIKTDSIISQKKLEITPNPFKEFTVSTPIYLYYEIYNLARDRDGSTYFRIDYKIGDDRQQPGVFTRLLQKVGLKKISGNITISSRYEGNSTTEFQFHRFDLPGNRARNLVLSVKVRDLNNNETATKRIRFSVK